MTLVGVSNYVFLFFFRHAFSLFLISAGGAVITVLTTPSNRLAASLPSVYSYSRGRGRVSSIPRTVPCSGLSHKEN